MARRIPDEEKETTNAVRSSAKRARKAADRHEPIDREKSRASRGDAKNVVRPTALSRETEDSRTEASDARGSKRRVRDREARPATKDDTAVDQRVVPAAVKQRFVQVGDTFFFPDGTRAFTDCGRKLTTPSENTEVVRSLISIAQARGWRDVTIEGSERFRKEAWFAAKLAGLDVRGYTPSELEQGQLIRRLARGASSDPEAASQELKRAQEREKEKDAGPGKREALITGTLLDHGQAHYRHDPNGPMSYFVRIETSRGEREIWGVDLERAFRESLTRPTIGDVVGLRAVGKEPVTVKSPKRDAGGKVIGERERLTHRNRWLVEQRDFFAARAHAARTLRDETVDPRDAVKLHPELAGTYVQLRAAELAARRIRDPEDQRTFVATVRRALADTVERGEPLTPVRLKGQAQEGGREAPSKHARERAEALARG